MNNRASAVVTAIIIIVVLAVITGGVWYFVINKPKACTQEAKLCPDGTYVSRTGPNCEFAECPTVKDQFKDWKTYQNEEYGFEVKYPREWDYITLQITTNPIMFAPKDIISKVNESIKNIKNDKSWVMWFNIYDKNLFEKGILPYRGKSNEYIKTTTSIIEVDGSKQNMYIDEYIKDKGDYKTGDRTVDVDITIKEGYLTIYLFDYEYFNTFEQILSTFKFIE
jgi:hypothetical protein